MSISTFDAVDRAERNTDMIQKCMHLIDAINLHLHQFPSSSFTDFRIITRESIEVFWLNNYYETNEQVMNVDKFSVSDLIFVTLCYLHIAENPLLRVCPNNDQSVLGTLNVLRFFGSQHTPETMFTWPSDDNLHILFDRIAWIVVSPIASLLPQTLQSGSPNLKLGWVSQSLHEEVIRVQRYAEPPKNSEGKLIREIQLGDFWTDAEPHSIFLTKASRIMHGLRFETYVLGLFPVDKDVEPITESIVTRLEMWLDKTCKIDSSDDFAQSFRDVVFDMLAPINSRANIRTRKQGGASGEVVSLTLLQFELGYDVADKLNNMFSVRVRNIGFDTQHVFYDVLLLHMFGHALLHALRIEFNKIFIITEANLSRDIKIVLQLSKYGRNREPIILRLHRSYYIHYVCKNTNEGRFRLCKNREVCLVWMTILREHYADELITGHVLTDWIDSFLK